MEEFFETGNFDKKVSRRQKRLTLYCMKEYQTKTKLLTKHLYAVLFSDESSQVSVKQCLIFAAHETSYECQKSSHVTYGRDNDLYQPTR